MLTQIYTHNQSIKQSINQLTSQSVHPSANQSINQSINQSVNQSIKQSASRRNDFFIPCIHCFLVNEYICNSRIYPHWKTLFLESLENKLRHITEKVKIARLFAADRFKYTMTEYSVYLWVEDLELDCIQHIWIHEDEEHLNCANLAVS